MDGNHLFPLSTDIELRPARSSPASLRRMLSPLLEDCIRDITQSIGRLRKLAEQAGQEEDRRAEAALRSKIIDQALAILRICGDEAATGFPKIASQDDLPQWEEVREQFIEGFLIAERAMGRHWSCRIEENNGYTSHI